MLELQETRSRFAERSWRRAQQRQAANAKAREEVEELQARYELGRAELEIGKADLKLAQTALREAEITLQYTKIKSPVNGVVIDRRVNLGQRVGPSANAPSLFLIARDLNRL